MYPPVADFAPRLIACLPGLADHPCPAGHAGGFGKCVRKAPTWGTWWNASPSVANPGRHAVRFRPFAGPRPGWLYEVVFEYALEEAGRYAAEAAVAPPGPWPAAKTTLPKPP
jgi:hypothetical protein